MSREPPLFPPDWADAWGDDVYGLWADFVVGEARQRMRWIEPGEFWMGSPTLEAERSGDEGPRHQVRITRGFWIADTACTQALWESTIGSNPSGFADDPLCPVEQVAFDDVLIFLKTLGSALRAGVADVPTEAEWEYACRAGTDAPFYFGGQISTEHANFDGNYPYNGGTRGEYRKRTVPVKAFSPNRWGLYQMHGNVWEWCRDGLRKFRSPMALDPEEVKKAAVRAVRGGSWCSYGRDCRCAYRYATEPHNRFNDLGFRFVLRA